MTDHSKVPTAADAGGTPTSKTWDKSVAVAYLLWFFVGIVAAHRLYTGRYVSAAIGKPRRRSSGWGRRDAAVAPFGSVHARRPELPTGGHAGDQRRDPPYADFVADRISHLAESARARRGIARHSPEQLALAAEVRRTLAWPEIVALAVACALFVGSLVV